MHSSHMQTRGKKNRPHVVIAGAGIGGLAAALSLLQKGIDCDVYEQAPQVREIGAAIWISPNGAKVLFELGLEDQLRSANLAATEREISLWSTGQACDALIGADGLHSKIRQAAFGLAPGTFTGVVAWRGLVPKESLPLSYHQPRFSTWIGPTAHVTLYHVRRGNRELVSFSGQADSAWQAESWSEEGSIEDCLKDFNGWHEDIRTLIKHSETLYKWGLFLRPTLERWSDNRVTLLGDACHSMVPYLGQGANMAIEDGFILARSFEKHPDNVAAALHCYQDARIVRTTKAVQGSMAMQNVFHNSALKSLETAEPYIKREWHPDKVAERNNWLFEYDATRVPI